MELANHIPGEDEVMRLFLTGRGHTEFRNLVRHAQEEGWARPDQRYVLQALYARLGVIQKTGGALEDLERFLRVLRETLGEANGAIEIKTRIEALIDYVLNLIKHEGGVNNDDVLDYAPAWQILESLKSTKNNSLYEDELRRFIPEEEVFNKALFSLLVSGLIFWTEDDDERVQFIISEKGINRLNPFSELWSLAQDIKLFTPILPIFDQMVLPFAGAIDTRLRQHHPECADALARFGVEVELESAEIALTNWKLDEFFLVRRSRNTQDLGVIVMPSAKPSKLVQEQSMTIAVGNTFVGYHLLIANSALNELESAESAPYGCREFPLTVDQMSPLVTWEELGTWLKQNDLRLELLADSATCRLYELMLNCSADSRERVSIREIESNSERLALLGPPIETSEEQGRLLRVASSTGPLLAIAPQAGLSILTTSWDMLAAAMKTSEFEEVSRAILRQHVHIAVPIKQIRERSGPPEDEDRVYRILGFIECLYDLIDNHTDLFAEYCRDEWKKMGYLFENVPEFGYDLSSSGTSFALAACYRWVGHRLSDSCERGWPERTEDIRRMTFWSQDSEPDSQWASVRAQRDALKAKVQVLLAQTLDMLGDKSRRESSAIKERVAELVDMGRLRAAEAGLRRALSQLRREKDLKEAN